MEFCVLLEWFIRKTILFFGGAIVPFLRGGITPCKKYRILFFVKYLENGDRYRGEV